VFDWSVVIGQYEALWAEMNARRRSAAPAPAPRRDLAGNPRRLDPFLLFGGYATEWLQGSTVVHLTPGQSWDSVENLLKSHLATYGGSALPSRNEIESVVERLSKVRQISVAELVAPLSAGRKPFVERGLLWMAKYQVITILPRSGEIVVSSLT
jgi:hypothetical protein